jgi:hypothetical protein
MYIESYPLSQPVDCNAVEGHGAVSILSFPTRNPAKLKFESFFDVSRAPLPNDAPIGCHDLQAWPERDLVIAACITEAQVWNIKNPAKPEILARITNPEVQVWHSAAFTWDGKYAIISDEYGGAAGGGGCTGDKDSPVGAMWFYDVTDPASPENVGHYSLPRVPNVDSPDELARFRCTTHIYTILPMKDPKKYIAVSSFYSGGISAVDFSDPANPKEIGHYLSSREESTPTAGRRTGTTGACTRMTTSPCLASASSRSGASKRTTCSITSAPSTCRRRSGQACTTPPGKHRIEIDDAGRSPGSGPGSRPASRRAHG